MGTQATEFGPEPVGLAAPLFEYDRTTQLGGAAVVSAGRYRRVSGKRTSWPLECVAAAADPASAPGVAPGVARRGLGRPARE